MYSSTYPHHSTIEQIQTLLKGYSAPNPDPTPSSSSHSPPQRRRRSGRAAVPAGGIQKRSGRQSRTITTLARAQDDLYDLRARIHKLDNEDWIAPPESEIRSFFRQPLRHVHDPLQYWYDQECDDKFGDIAPLAAGLFSVPGKLCPLFLRSLFMLRVAAIASTLFGPFPFRHPAFSVNLVDPAAPARVILQSWFGHPFVPEVELMNDIEGEIVDEEVEFGSDDIVELEAPPAAARDSSVASNSSIPELSFGVAQGRRASEMM